MVRKSPELDVELQRLQLPVTVTSVSDVSRLLREVKALNDFMAQAAVRSPGTSLKLPHMSRSTDELTKQNNLNVLHEVDRQKTEAFLTSVKATAPVLHMSLTADPSAVFLQKVVTWLRTEIHPQILLQVGLQPTIAAGCIVRTQNHYYDFSLRRHFDQHKAVLVEKIGAL